jgi:hypothetical protein
MRQWQDNRWHHLLSKGRLRRWLIFYKEGGGFLTSGLKLLGVEPEDLRAFYKKSGDDQLELVEKYITEKLKDDHSEKMTRTELAFLGYNALIDIAQQLEAELTVNAETARLRAVEEEERKKRVDEE